MHELDDPWGHATDMGGYESTPSGHRRWIAALSVGALPAAVGVSIHGDAGRGATMNLLAAGVASTWLTGRFLSRFWLLPTLVILYAATAALTVPSVGGAPCAIMAVCSTLAGLAVGQPSRSTNDAPSTSSFRLLAVAGAGVGWVRTGSLPLALVGLAISAAVAVVVTVKPNFGLVVDRAIDKFFKGLGEVLRTVVISVLLLPLVVLPVFAGRVAREIRDQVVRSESAWVRRRVRPQDETRDAVGPWVPVSASTRRLRTAGGVAVAMFVIVGVVTVTTSRQPPQGSTDGPTVVTPSVTLGSMAAFASVPWADEMQQEHSYYGTHHLPLDSELGYVAGDFDGKYTQVTGGVRRSVPSSCSGCPRATVWWFGGSAAWGEGQRDEHTIASELVRIAEADGIALDISNMAVQGWTMWQESRLFLRNLQTHDEPPDLALFYDGFNDAAAAVTESALNGRIDPDEPLLLDGGRFTRYGQTHPSLDPAGGPDAVGSDAARKYRELSRSVEGAAEPSNLAVQFILQADALVSPPQLDYVKAITKSEPTVVPRSEFAATFRAFQRGLGSEVVDLRNTFRDETRPVFSDPAHTNELGARIVAEAIYAKLSDQIHELAESGGT